MEITVGSWVALSLVFVSIIVRWVWKALDWVWFKPKRLERCLREQGLKGNSYRLFYGDMKENSILLKQAKSKPMNLSGFHDIAPRLIPIVDQSVKTYGKNSFVWIGPIPRVNIMNPEDIKAVFTNIDDFQKPALNPFFRMLITGIASYEGEKWAKHRRIINATFHVEKLKRMLPAFHQSCNEMITEWKSLVPKQGSSCELDVWPSLQNLTPDVISRTAFGSSYHEGKKIFELLKEQMIYTLQTLQSVYIPGWRFIPTKMNRRLNQIDKEIKGLLKGVINKREQALKAASVLLVWTIVLLGQNQNWQDRARQEVLQVFGSNKPDFDGLNHLKVVTMILLEVLRLYPALVVLFRTTHKKTQLGKFSLPAGVEVGLPTLLIHRDKELWGDDANEFKPERFSEGISKASKSQLSFVPFGGGPRICIGQNFSLIEAKLVVALILQHFTFELSPSYAHAPSTPTIQPQYGVPIILRRN
ncbi:hypothetical protein M0R45_009560 [Rubus argutus]|uniref:Cytochrome P450 n=1 Tax=Rubus argutus TaxID=59490 RepID=A0AAW1Y4B5_RUBAR